jgi:hypothetical protein
MECDVSCLGEHDGHGHLIVSRPRFYQYLVYVRGRGERKFKLVGKSRSRAKAGRILMEEMLEKRHFRGLLCGDEGPMSYFEPTTLLEVKR